MTNEELLNKMREAYEKRKVEISKDLHDYDYWELYIRYELCEWLETVIIDYLENYTELIEYLKTRHNPLEWLYDIMLDRDEELWDIIADATDYQMRWEKEHGYDK